MRPTLVLGVTLLPQAARACGSMKNATLLDFWPILVPFILLGGLVIGLEIWSFNHLIGAAREPEKELGPSFHAAVALGVLADIALCLCLLFPVPLAKYVLVALAYASRRRLGPDAAKSQEPNEP